MSTALTAVAHRINVKKLYKSILRLHRGLPQEMRLLGDVYVKDEFRRNKAASTPDQIQRFMLEWTDYTVSLSQQLSSNALVKAAKVGRDLPAEKLDAFTDEQIRQLFLLKNEAEDPLAFSKERLIGSSKASKNS